MKVFVLNKDIAGTDEESLRSLKLNKDCILVYPALAKDKSVESLPEKFRIIYSIIRASKGEFEDFKEIGEMFEDCHDNFAFEESEVESGYDNEKVMSNVADNMGSIISYNRFILRPISCYFE